MSMNANIYNCTYTVNGKYKCRVDPIVDSYGQFETNYCGNFKQICNPGYTINNKYNNCTSLVEVTNSNCPGSPNYIDYNGNCPCIKNN
jgi:hypothetical protein